MSEKTTYTAEDIRLYLEGKLSPGRMHEMEKAALSDPFLADAIEGMEVHGDKQKFDADVEELRARLAGRTKSRRGALVSVSSLWWKIAAVLFVVITGVVIIIFTGEKNNEPPNEIAKTEYKTEGHERKETSEAAATTKSADAGQKIKSDELNDTVKRDTLSKNYERKSRPVTTLKKPEPVKNADAAIIEKDDETGIQQEVAAAKKPAAQAAREVDSVSVATAAPRAEAQNQAKVSRQLEGKVSGVDVSREEENDSMFDEVVVVGYGSTKARNARSKNVSAGRFEKRVIPGNGWEEFQRYIADSASINSADSLFTGEEQLSFTIGDDGLPESIKILRSISPSHDREAIRLLQNGPSWKVAKGRKREIRLKIIF